MKYAVISTGGKQYKVTEGQVLEVERLGSSDKQIFFDKVLLVVSDGDQKVGTPFISGMNVSASVVDQVKGEKIRVSKFKSKVRTRRTTGHRQSLTLVKIESIGTTFSKPAKTEKTAVKRTRAKKT